MLDKIPILKTAFQDVSGAEVLRRLSAVPVSTWSYKAEGEGVRHMGPVAQDFAAAFHLGNDDKHITTIDEGGVALAAIQELYRENQELKAALAALQARVAGMAPAHAHATTHGRRSTHNGVKQAKVPF